MLRKPPRQTLPAVRLILWPMNVCQARKGYTIVGISNNCALIF
jgi:hypothetical protein